VRARAHRRDVDVVEELAELGDQLQALGAGAAALGQDAGAVPVHKFAVGERDANKGNLRVQLVRDLHHARLHFRVQHALLGVAVEAVHHAAGGAVPRPGGAAAGGGVAAALDEQLLALHGACQVDFQSARVGRHRVGVQLEGRAADGQTAA
jgi:hypothetical protein